MIYVFREGGVGWRKDEARFHSRANGSNVSFSTETEQQMPAKNVGLQEQNVLRLNAV